MHGAPAKFYATVAVMALVAKLIIATSKTSLMQLLCGAYS
jgi:hypothetical protein